MAGAVIYALGGGAGHLARATVYAARSCAPGAPVTILHSAAARIVEPPGRGVELVAVPISSRSEDVGALLRTALGKRRQRELVVDAFPGGLGGEIDAALLASASRTTLVRRYVKPFAYDHYVELAARFDRHVMPYSTDRCEWSEEDVAIADRPVLFAGPLVRQLEIGRGARASLAVIGDSTRLGAGVRRLLPKDTVFVRGPFRALPPAQAYLSVGAGYNIAYELDRLGVPFALVPEDRRYDDQFRRADLLGRSLGAFGSVESLLAEAA